MAWFLWMVRGDGAEWLEPHIHWFEYYSWSADDIRSFARVEIVLATIFFVAGLFLPEQRFFFLPGVFDDFE